MAKIAFLGLGVMGFPMAGHLAAAGHEVTVYNRSPARPAAWLAAHKGRSAPTPAKAAEGAEIVFACVGRDDDVRAVATGPDGAFGAMAKGALFVDHHADQLPLTVEDTSSFGKVVVMPGPPLPGGKRRGLRASLNRDRDRHAP